MKTIRIKSLTLLNFKGIRNETYTFGQTTIISGRNGLGKTTIFDAFLWLLFNKNANGSTAFGIKTYDENGDVIPRLSHEVTAILDINGEETTLRKTLTEKWVKPRGKVTEEFQGNETSYEVNNVPYKAKEYTAYINSILSEDSFRAATNPNFFPSLHWEAQKQLLISLVGGVTQDEITAGTQTFARLLAEITGKGIEAYRKEVVATINRLKAESESIEPRIDEVKRSLPAEPDLEQQKQEVSTLSTQITEADDAIKKLQEEITSIDNALADDSRRLDEANKERNELLRKKAELQNRQTELYATINNEATEEYSRLVSLRNIAITNRQAVEKDIRNIEYDIERKRADKEHQEKQITELKAKMKALFDEEDRLKLQFYNADSDTCPMCGQRLPEDKIDENEKTFNTKKANRLKEINDEIEKLRSEGKQTAAAIQDITQQIAAQMSKADSLRKSLKPLPAEPVAPIVDCQSDLRYIALQNEIDAINARLANTKPTAESKDNFDLVLRKSNANDKIAELESANRQHHARINEITAANKSYAEQTERLNARIDELTQQLRDIYQRIADLEQMQDLIYAYKQREVSILESKVNNKFTLCRWRFYKPLVNGGQEETCECTINGVPYADANRAAQINAGIDIINAFQSYNDFCAPIFIDNAEAVNTLLPTPAQVVALYVTTDNTLTIKTI